MSADWALEYTCGCVLEWTTTVDPTWGRMDGPRITMPCERHKAAGPVAADPASTPKPLSPAKGMETCDE